MSLHNSIRRAIRESFNPEIRMPKYFRGAAGGEEQGDSFRSAPRPKAKTEHTLDDLLQHITNPRDRRIYRKVWELGEKQKKLLAEVQQPVWRSFDGSVRTPQQMDNGHLLNAIRMQQRRCETDKPIFAAMVLEAAKRCLIP